MTDEPRKIIKRDGREVDFDKDKIYQAIKKASDEDQRVRRSRSFRATAR